MIGEEVDTSAAKLAQSATRSAGAFLCCATGETGGWVDDVRYIGKGRVFFFWGGGGKEGRCGWRRGFVSVVQEQPVEWLPICGVISKRGCVLVLRGRYKSNALAPRTMLFPRDVLLVCGGCIWGGRGVWLLGVRCLGPGWLSVAVRLPKVGMVRYQRQERVELVKSDMCSCADGEWWFEMHPNLGCRLEGGKRCHSEYRWTRLCRRRGQGLEEKSQRS